MADASAGLSQRREEAMAWAVAVAVGAEPMQEARPWVHAWATAWVVAVDWEPDSAWAAALAAAEALPPPMAWATAWAEAALLPEADAWAAALAKAEPLPLARACALAVAVAVADFPLVPSRRAGTVMAEHSSIMTSSAEVFWIPMMAMIECRDGQRAQGLWNV